MPALQAVLLRAAPPIALVLGACGGSEEATVDAAVPSDVMAADVAVPDAANPDGAPPDAGTPDAAVADAAVPITVDCEGSPPGPGHHQYVFSALDMPATASQALILGVDLDGDPMARPDNAVGQLLATLGSQAHLDLQVGMDAAIANGDLRHVLHVDTPDLNTNGAATAQTFVAGDCDEPTDPSDDFSSTETFGPLPDALTNAVLPGAVVDGVVRVAGAEPIELSIALLGGSIVRLPISGAMLEAIIIDGEITGGKIGGGLLEADIEAVFIPALTDDIQGIVNAECTGGTPCCPEGTTGETLINLFDYDADCEITADEIRVNDLISSLLIPDVDLFDATGNYAPRVDGVNDSLSVGLGFTAVPAVLPIAPDE